MADDLLTDDLLTQDHKRLREYFTALRDAWRVYEEQQPVVPDLGDVLADAAKAVADKEQQELRAQLEQARRIAVELENEVARLRDRLRCGDARALREAAGRFEAACPDHSDSPEVGVVCRCDSAGLLRHMAAVLEVAA
ncbi:hypothetical protein ACH4GK_32105 [Streptomyces rimosus]|uniref:hypothetical protein n=1 Tax=Streptomyces rimosus TaxID=1927 RepID=UPI0004CA913C|nr:hypothetical protein [Streptomyces rimosus]